MGSRTPMPSVNDQDNKCAMREMVAAAAAALGSEGDAAMSASADAPAGASLSPAAAANDDYYSGFMAFNALRHNEDVARRQAQLSADRPLSPEPDSLPFPSFLTQSLGAPAGGSTPAAAPRQAAPRDLVPSAAGAGVSSGAGGRAALGPYQDDGERLGAAAPKKPSAAARAPSARAGSRRPVATPGSGSKLFTPERARAAASKRWSAAAARRRASGVPSLASLPGGATPTPGGDESAASTALLALRSTAGSSPAASAGVTGKGIASPAASRSAAAEAAAASKAAAVLSAANAPSQARTAATTKAAAAARAAKGGSRGSVGGARKVAGGGKETDGGIKCSGGKASVVSKAGGSKADGVAKFSGASKAGGDCPAVQIVDGAEDELDKVKGEVAKLLDEVLRLRTQLVNLTSTVKTNTRQIDTQGHSLELQACSIGEIKIMLRKDCKPAPRPSVGSDQDEDGDEEDAPPRKRVRFALDVQVAPPSTATGAVAEELSPPPSPPSSSRVLTVSSPVSSDEVLLGQVPSRTPPLSPEQATRVRSPQPPARISSVRNDTAGNESARHPRSSRPLGPVIALSDDPSKRRAEGTAVMQGIRDLLKPRVSELIADAVLTVDVFLDPESKFEMIAETTVESMNVTSAVANAFLLEMINQPTKKRVRGSVAPRAVRACAPLGMVFSHTMSAIKAVVVAGWFAGVNSTAATMLVGTAQEWKIKRKYGQSEGGRVGVIAASKRMFKHLGARYRVKEPTTEGDVVVVHETLGHYALVCTMVAEALDTIITGSSSGGPDGDRFKRYVDEAVSLDSYLPKHNRPQNGLAIVDGADPNRAVFPDEYMPAPVDDEGIGAAPPPVAEV